jgi:hypothetical protein
MSSKNRAALVAALLAAIVTALPATAGAQTRGSQNDYRVPGTGIRIFPGPYRVRRFGGITIYETYPYYWPDRRYDWRYGRPRDYVWPYSLRR